jgi:hypothetical protein
MVNAANSLRRLRGFLLAEAGLLIAASLVHSGLLVQGHFHSQARIAEAVIAVVLLAAWALSLAWPVRMRQLALWAQAFAFAGTLVGLSTIIIGIGPQSAPDKVFHFALLGVLLAGLRAARHSPKNAS